MGGVPLRRRVSARAATIQSGGSRGRATARFMACRRCTGRVGRATARANATGGHGARGPNAPDPESTRRSRRPAGAAGQVAPDAVTSRTRNTRPRRRAPAPGNGRGDMTRRPRWLPPPSWPRHRPPASRPACGCSTPWPVGRDDPADDLPRRCGSPTAVEPWLGDPGPSAAGSRDRSRSRSAERFAWDYRPGLARGPGAAAR